MSLRFIVLTGGPGGGKTTLVEELLRDPVWRSRVVALPEAISLTRGLGVSPAEPRFQRLMVALQMALEDALHRALGDGPPRLVLCHRGSLDPLAYWLARGWAEEEFFVYTATTRQEHYARYDAIIHLVTAAEGALHAYRRYPEAHRGETPQEAVHLDGLLRRVWGGHPRDVLIDNAGRDWPAKSAAARQALEQCWQEAFE